MTEIWKKSGKGNEETYTSKTPERKISVTFNYNYGEIEVVYKELPDKIVHFLCGSIEQCNEILKRNNIKLVIPNDLQF